jgi:hypothetical protein
VQGVVELSAAHLTHEAMIVQIVPAVTARPFAGPIRVIAIGSLPTYSSIAPAGASSAGPVSGSGPTRPRSHRARHKQSSKSPPRPRLRRPGARLAPDQVRDGDVEHDVIRYGGHVSGERLLLGALCALAEPQPGGAVRLVMRVRGSGRRRRWP